jgi:hypothetical protein
MGTAGAAGTAAGSGVLGTLKTIAKIASPMASLMQAASGMSAVKKMGAGAPAIPTPITMPIAGGPDMFQAQQNSLAAQLQRRGRQSTILTSPDGTSDKLGG